MTSPLHIVQITDTHLVAEPGGRVHGVDTEAALLRTLDAIKAGPAPDLVMVTGDLTQDGSAAAYRRLGAHLRTLPCPVHCLPGNHDEPATLAAEVAGGNVAVTPALRAGAWDLILLDSTIAGEDDGRLGARELARLDHALATGNAAHAMVALHHHPVVVGGAWGDWVGLKDAAALFAVLDRHPKVRALIWGHIHQAFTGARGNLALLGAPSTCFQFRRDDAGELAADGGGYAYRRLVLGADGTIDSMVVSLA